MENVAEARGWSETQKNALFGEADKFEPDYFYSPRARAYYLFNQNGADSPEIPRDLLMTSPTASGASRATSFTLKLRHPRI